MTIRPHVVGGYSSIVAFAQEPDALQSGYLCVRLIFKGMSPHLKQVGALFWVKKMRDGARVRTKNNGSVHIVGQNNRVGALFGKENRCV